MSELNCNSCTDLRSNSADFVSNGVTTAVCTSLKNDTGFNTSSGHNDCEDLDLANDCLIGNLEDELERYEICDWKDYMRQLVPNTHEVIKAMICSTCGIWTNIHSIWEEIAEIWEDIRRIWNRINSVEDQLDRIDCIIDYMSTGTSFAFTEYDTNLSSHIIAGKGVSFLNVSASGTASDISIVYIAGGLAHITGACRFYTSNFTDAAAVYNFDNNGTSPTKSSSRLGNSYWDSSTPKPITGGELIYEIMIKKSEYPQLKAFYRGFGLESAGGAFHAGVWIRDGDSTTGAVYASGQHGYCNSRTGEPAVTGADSGHRIPSGWISVQVRMSYMDLFHGSSEGAQYTPECLLGIRLDKEGISC